jgi:hypothetical protein
LAIPPNETGTFPQPTTADWRSAIIASWLHRLRRVDDITYMSDVFSLDEEEELQRITMFAIDSVLLKKRYTSYKAHK